jgi:molybdate transport system substrate-binding protein
MQEFSRESVKQELRVRDRSAFSEENLFSKFRHISARCNRLFGVLINYNLVFATILLLSFQACRLPVRETDTLLAYVGAASKPPTEEAAAYYEQKTGTKINLIFGGSGYVLSQMKLAKKGDVYFPGSSDYMEKAKRDGDVLPDSERIIVYLVSAINVQKDNPHNIKTLHDLTRPGLRVAIANPEGVCVGAYAVEIIENNFTQIEKEAFLGNLVNYTESCEKTATAISLNLVDAVIGWRVFEHWDPVRIETVPLLKEQILRVGYIPAAISSFTKNESEARRFIEFLTSPEGQAIYAKYKYFSSVQDTFDWIGEDKPVGGEYIVPKDWIK